jgi:hypothetical protein
MTCGTSADPTFHLPPLPSIYVRADNLSPLGGISGLQAPASDPPPKGFSPGPSSKQRHQSLRLPHNPPFLTPDYLVRRFRIQPT